MQIYQHNRTEDQIFLLPWDNYSWLTCSADTKCLGIHIAQLILLLFTINKHEMQIRLWHQYLILMLPIDTICGSYSPIVSIYEYLQRPAIIERANNLCPTVRISHSQWSPKGKYEWVVVSTFGFVPTHRKAHI